MTETNSFTPLDLRSVESVRKEIKAKLAIASAEAKAAGKKLLIVVGEQHYKREGLLLLLMTMEAARKHGVKNLAIEIGPEKFDWLKKEPFDPLFIINGFISIPYSEQILGWNAFPIDKENLSEKDATSDQGMLDRESYMIEQLLQSPENIVAVVGTTHIPAFIESKHLDQNYILVNLCVEFSTITKPAATPLITERLEYLKNPTKINSFSFAGDPHELPLWDVLSYVLGKQKLQKLKEHLINVGRLPSKGKIKIAFDEANAKIGTNPENPAHYIQRANAYSDAGQYEEAWYDYYYVVALEAQKHGKESPQYLKAAQAFKWFNDMIPASLSSRLLAGEKQLQIAPEPLPPLTNG
jgi:hypothetical protein